MNQPRSRVDLDKQLVGMARGVKVMYAVLLTMCLAALVLVVVLYGNQASTVQHAVTHAVAAQCAFFQDIGNVPVVSPQTSVVGAKLLVDSRNAFIGSGCAGHLAPPSPLLLELVKKFGLHLLG